MRNVKPWSVVVIALVGLGWLGMAPPSMAEKPGKGKKDPDALFKKIDANGDGQITKEEMKKFREQRAASKGKTAKKGKGKGKGGMFKKLDTNNDGVLTPDEFRKIAELKKGKGKQQ